MTGDGGRDGKRGDWGEVLGGEGGDHREVWMPRGRMGGKDLESGPACLATWQTDKINAKVNKDIAVTEKEPEIFLSLFHPARWPLSVRLCLVSGARERDREPRRLYCS